MKINVKDTEAGQSTAEGLVIGVFEGALDSGDFASIDKTLGGMPQEMAKKRKFEGKDGQSLAFETLGALPADYVVVAGLGKKEDFVSEKARLASGRAVRLMKAAGVKSCASALITCVDSDESAKEVAQAVVEGSQLALYTFDNHKKEKSTKKLDNYTVLAPGHMEAATIGVKRGEAIAEAVSLARDLINTPANYATPTYLGAQASAMGRKYGFKCVSHKLPAINKLKMGGLLGVAQGSVEEPRFIVMEWMKGPKSKKPIVIVGKGLTFDTGGISLKPSLNMHEMKSDMSGGAATIAVMTAVAAMKLKVNLVGLVPATENMPSGSANKPGDVLTGLSGVTMEVLNTDAEGRLILADGLAYAARYKPDCTVDIATLTGACMVALGAHCSGLLGNDEDLINQLREAGTRTGERLWPLPLFKEYEDDIKSQVADISNIGPRGGGASTAAAFLKAHVKGKWAHLDIAGTAFTDREKGYTRKGATGVGVRVLVDFILKRSGIE